MSRADYVRELTMSGLTKAEIAERVGLKSVRQVARIQKDAGVKSRKNAVISDEVKARMRYLSEVEGWPPCEISATLGVNIKTVKNGYVTPGPGLEWRDTARDLARQHGALFYELRRGLSTRGAV